MGAIEIFEGMGESFWLLTVYFFIYLKIIRTKARQKPLLYTSQLVLRIEILLRSVQEAAFGEGYVSEFCGETYSEV